MRCCPSCADADVVCSGAEAVDVKLTPEDIKYLEEPYKPTAVFGHM